jgi:hypothetical protein
MSMSIYEDGWIHLVVADRLLASCMVVRFMTKIETSSISNSQFSGDQKRLGDSTRR